MSEKVALITGITGQDGAYLAKLLLDEGYAVYGCHRRSSTMGQNFWRLEYLNLFKNKSFFIVEADLNDFGSCLRLVQMVKPNEIYNLAAQSFVATSFDQPLGTAQINSFGPLNLLESIRTVGEDIKFYQASTSEMFGKVQEVPQTENTSFYPRSPYAAAKLYAHWITVNYRESYNIFASSGILFNHESPLRGEEFVTRKITKALARIKLGNQSVLELGNIYAKRDWGFAGEYVEGMHKMLQANEPDTFILATGRTETIKNFLNEACEILNFKSEWVGEGIEEKLIDKEVNKTIVRINEKFYRPAEVDLLVGDASKAKKKLSWEPKVKFNELIKMMVEADYDKEKKVSL